MRELEAQVTDLRINNAGWPRPSSIWPEAVKTLTVTVQTSRHDEQGPRRLWMAMLLAGGIGAALTTVIKRVFGIL